MKPDAGNVLRSSLLAGLLLLCSTLLYGQFDIPVNTWRTHYSYRNGVSLEFANGQVFCGAENGFFMVDGTELSMSVLSKLDGFSDVSVTAAGFDAIHEVLVLGYENGNIDLLRENEITNIDLIRDANIGQPKHINHINTSQDLAVLSAGFGFILLDLAANRVIETIFNIGEEGSEIEVFASCFFSDSLFLATDQGVIAANVNDNLLDFNIWHRFDSDQGIPREPVRAITVFDGKVYAGIDNLAILTYVGAGWDTTSFTVAEPFMAFKAYPEELLVTTEGAVFSYRSEADFDEIDFSLIERPVGAVRDDLGRTWIVDQVNGLVAAVDGGKQFIPGGPLSDNMEGVKFVDDRIITYYGGRNEFNLPRRNEQGFDVFQDAEWVNYSNPGLSNTEGMPEFMDITDVTYSNTVDRIIFSSFGYGLLEWDGVDGFTVTDENTPGSTLENLNPPGRNTYVTAVLPADGVWAANFESSTTYHFRDQEGGWTPYAFNSLLSRNPVQLVESFTTIWARIAANQGGGLFVFDPETIEERYLNSFEGNGSLPSNVVNDISVDNDGQVWVATNLGIVFFPNPFIVFEGSVDAAIPIYENRQLFRDERITQVEADAGNRLWIGTEDGVWLFSEGTEELIHHFTVENSPLPSNLITGLTIDSNTGEVFILTDHGMVSFRSGATKAEPDHKQVKIFPNPVLPDFRGHVGISGLVENARIKITDVSGKLVRELRASGGTAIWDVADFSGRRPASGIYLVFSSSNDGEESFVGKIAVIE